jgi:hypothetical protein
VAILVAVATSACAAIEGLDHYGPGSGGSDATVDGRVVTGDSSGGVVPGDSGEEGVPGEDASDATVTPDGDAMAIGASDAPPSTDDAPDFDAGNCMTAMVDPVHGVFVAGGPDGGTDGAGCGTSPTNPCASIGAGITTATSKPDGAARSIVYVSAGLYTEKVTLPGGVTVQGGWHWGGGSTWTFDCTSAPESAVVVQAPSGDNMTVVATSNNGMTATLSVLTVLSKPEANVQPGESLYGVYATGNNTVLTLTDVVVTMQAGGAGQPGTTGAAGTNPASCSPGDGASAASSTVGTVGSAGAAGSFSGTGFTTHAGGTGGNGVAGDHGPVGGPATPVTYTACTSVTTNPASCMQSATLSCVGGTGVNGCGGGSGSGGTGGGGGGSSVAIFANNAAVTITGGAFEAGSGGNGGAGGVGGAGGTGSAGATGPTTSCATSSCSGTMCMPSGSSTTAPGGAAPTTPAGQGSAGGLGGGGAGGDSYAIVTLGAATAVLSLSRAVPPALGVGRAGTGAGTAPNGSAAVQGMF